MAIEEPHTASRQLQSPPPSEQPSLKSLLDNVEVTDWYTLGLNLGVSVTDLDFIKADHVSAKDSLRETFQCVP